MVLNRRHKAFLFVTLVITGCSLRFGVELKDALGFLMLGVEAQTTGANSDVQARVTKKLAQGG
jgi:hypothetical protein